MTAAMGTRGGRLPVDDGVSVRSGDPEFGRSEPVLFHLGADADQPGDEDVKLEYSYRAERGGEAGWPRTFSLQADRGSRPTPWPICRGWGYRFPKWATASERCGGGAAGSEVEAVVRTTTVVADGRAGLAYPGVAEEEGFTEAVYLCGLRQNAQDRSNVAFQNMGAPGEGAITLRTTVYSGERRHRAAVLEDVELEPGGFHQYSPVLGDVANGYVKVERVEGRAPFYAYGVINDQANSGRVVCVSGDGEFTGGEDGADPAGDCGDQRVHQRADGDKLLRGGQDAGFPVCGGGIEADNNTAAFSMTLEAGQQEIVAEVVEALRRQEVAGLGTSRVLRGTLVCGGGRRGHERDRDRGQDGLRGRRRSYSVFYNAVPLGEAFSQEAWVEGLQQNQETGATWRWSTPGRWTGAPASSIWRSTTGRRACWPRRW